VRILVKAYRVVVAVFPKSFILKGYGRSLCHG
jgi:hypothetical protein